MAQRIKQNKTILFIGIAIIAIIGAYFLFNGGSKQSIYVCPDGSKVLNPNQCTSVSAPAQDNRDIVGQNAGSSQSAVIEDKIPLKVMDLSCSYGDYGWIYAKGRIKNEGSRDAKYVKVSIDLYNGDKWVDSDFTYIRNTDLPAGAIDSFEQTWTDDSIVFTRCEAFATYSEILS